MLQVKGKEGERILAKINDQDHVFVLVINYSTLVDAIGFGGADLSWVSDYAGEPYHK